MALEPSASGASRLDGADDALLLELFRGRFCPMKSFRAILFDLDGVLIDSYHLWFHLLNRTAADFGYPEISLAQFHPTWGQGIEADIRDFFPGMTVERLIRFFKDHYASYTEHLVALAGGAEALRTVRHLPTGGSRKLGCITNSQTSIATLALERVGLLKYFDEVLGADDAGCSKPEPGGVLMLCQRLEVAPTEALMIGDSRFDAMAAHAAGVSFLGLGMAEPPTIASLLELPDYLEREEGGAGN